MPLRPGSADKVVHFGACLVLLPAASGFVMGSAEAGIGMLIVFGAPLYFFSLDSPITALSAPVRLAAMASFSATGVLLGAFPPGGSDAPLLARLGTALLMGAGVVAADLRWSRWWQTRARRVRRERTRRSRGA